MKEIVSKYLAILFITAFMLAFDVSLLGCNPILLISLSCIGVGMFLWLIILEIIRGG